MSRLPSLLPVVLLLCAAPAHADALALALDLVPWPERVERVDGALSLARGVVVDIDAAGDPRIAAAAARALQAHGVRFVDDVAAPRLTLRARAPSRGPWPTLDDDERYTITIDAREAVVEAAEPVGLLRALATLAQLLTTDAAGPSWPHVRIDDAPRFPWRGLLLDPARRFLSVETVVRALDGMEAAKLNVLHWHLTDDQAFRLALRGHPELAARGTPDGRVYSADDVRRVVEAAAARGIRVVPELDVPAHTTSWLVSHPEVAAGTAPAASAETWGVFDAALDPTDPRTDALLDDVLGEVARMFPDRFVHVGGDEVTGVAWRDDPAIAAHMRDARIDAHALQARFMARVVAMLKAHGKRAVGWDEILDGDVDPSTVGQAWRGEERVRVAIARGQPVLVSHAYYLDHMLPAWVHWVDPVPAGVDAARILGGEACMWGEFVDERTLDSRLWPRAGAIAERLWSAAPPSSVDVLYRRLDALSALLHRRGLRHVTARRELLAGLLVDGSAAAALATLADVVRPLQLYWRPAAQRYTTGTPLDRLVDAAAPESARARAFSRAVDRYLASGDGAAALRAELTTWRDALPAIVPAVRDVEVVYVARDLSRAAAAGLEAIAAIERRRRLDARRATVMRADLAAARVAKAEVQIEVVPAIERLVDAAER